MQVHVVGFERVSFSFERLFQLLYDIHVFSREMMGISHFHIMIKCKVRVHFDVPHNVPLPLVSSLLRASRERNANIDITCTPILIMRHLWSMIM